MNKVLYISKIPLILAILLALLISTKYSLAVSSDWVVNDKSKVRLISAKTSIDNSNNILLALEYQLEKDWKTYWKSPGGGGFPQKIIWNNSQNIENTNRSMDYPLKQARENFEKNYLLTQLKKNKGNISKTAQFIGMERSALHRKLKSLGIKGIN